MRKPWVLVLMLLPWLSASAQENRGVPFTLPDEGSATDASGSPAPQDKKQGTEVIITADKLQDELPTGPTNKPMWTDHRPSPQTRVYLQVDSGEVEFEQWVEIRINRDPSVPTEVRLSEEFEFGLGNRFQLDLYANTVFESAGGLSTLAIRSWAAELRYALADWGVIFGNPTLYLEYILWNNQPDGHGDGASGSLEGKLLLGDEIAPGWHWGSNLFYEHTFNGSVLETGGTLSVMRTIVDRVLSGGIAVLYVYESDGAPLVPGSGRVRTHGLYLGPSIQVKLAPYQSEVESNGAKVKVTKSRGHLDLEPVFGLTNEADRARVLIVFGWDF
jgi:hypothetical protein